MFQAHDHVGSSSWEIRNLHLPFINALIVVYDIIEALRSWMIANNVKPLSEHEIAMKRKLERSEMKAPETPVSDAVIVLSPFV